MDSNSEYDYKRYMNLMYDRGFRNKLKNDPKSCVENLGYTVGTHQKVAVHVSEKDKIYFVLPGSNIATDTQLLNQLAAGRHQVPQEGTTSTVGSLGSAGSAGTVTSTVSSISTAGTAGSAGTVDMK